MRGSKIENPPRTQILKGLGAELSCPVCGTVFLRSSADWAYRITTVRRRSRHKDTAMYFCSYKCMRAAQKEQEARDNDP